MSNVDTEVCDGHAELLHSVEIADGHSVVLEGVKVDCDGEGDTALVCACVALTDGLSGVVDLGRDTSTCQGLLYTRKVNKLVNILLTYVLNKLVDLLVGNQRKNRTLQGCDQRWEYEIGTRGLMRTDTEAVLENAINDTTNTERGFNN